MAHGVTLKLRKIQPMWRRVWHWSKGQYRKYVLPDGTVVPRAIARNIQFKRGPYAKHQR